MANLSIFEEPELSDASRGFRRSVLLVLLFFTATFGLMFEILNFAQGNYALMLVEIPMTCLAIALMPVVRRTRNLMRWSALFLLLFNIVMMYALSVPSSGPSVFAWVLLVPILSQLLLGRWLGTAMVVVFMSIAGVIYFLRYSADPLIGNLLALANVAGAALSIFGFSLVYELSRSRAEEALRSQARTDLLTGLGNRVYLAEQFRQRKQEFTEKRKPFCLLMLDIDHFKSINDKYGHDAGDSALHWIAGLIDQEMGKDDTVCRYGGEEFCVLIADSNTAAARSSAERIRARIAETEFATTEHRLALTASIGMTEIDSANDSLANLISAADRHLYEAKRAGRNRVVG